MHADAIAVMSAMLPTRLYSRPSAPYIHLFLSYVKIVSRCLSPTGNLHGIRAIRMRGVSMSNQSS